mmetsp:Transcript_25795/g.44037  ORF Transcript_25795/g.44037 Transcript_25795/m.44037 type:complete len:279 (+) Transcript_25795:92-928(+)
MSYQSNPNRAVEETYDDSSPITGHLLPGAGVNVGASNSAMGEGTTTAELVAKFRFLNSGACLFILLFHTMKIAFNPIRLTLLMSSPIRFILEIVVGALALFLFLVEARVPVLGEKVLVLMKRFAVGGNQLIDLDVARGRALTLLIIGGSLGMINYLARSGASSSKSGVVLSDETAPPSVNGTDVDVDMSESNEEVSSSLFFTIIQCTVFSPTALIAFSLSSYTFYVMHTFPEYAQSKAYSIEDGPEATVAGTGASTGPSWVSNVGDLVRGNGYQNVGA